MKKAYDFQHNKFILVGFINAIKAINLHVIKGLNKTTK